MEICIDFDGTCTTHEYPRVGLEIGAVPVLKKLIEKGHNLILFTMRSGDQLREAYNWFLKNDIPVYGIQTNPTQIMWTQSPKAYGQLYIDDAALGCPLSTKELVVENIVDQLTRKCEERKGVYYNKPERPYVDWIKVEKLLIKQEVL